VPHALAGRAGAASRTRERVAFERDRLKVAKLRAAGLGVMPVTGRQIRREPDAVIARLLAALRS
jgi:hypothetical protein